MEPLKKALHKLLFPRKGRCPFKCPSVGLSAGIYFLIRYAACQPSCIYSLSCFGLLVNGCMYEWVPALSEGCRFCPPECLGQPLYHRCPVSCTHFPLSIIGNQYPLCCYQIYFRRSLPLSLAGFYRSLLWVIGADAFPIAVARKPPEH